MLECAGPAAVRLVCLNHELFGCLQERRGIAEFSTSLNIFLQTNSFFMSPKIYKKSSYTNLEAWHSTVTVVSHLDNLVFRVAKKR